MSVIILLVALGRADTYLFDDTDKRGCLERVSLFYAGNSFCRMFIHKVGV
jgi:hypothetical protein